MVLDGFKIWRRLALFFSLAGLFVMLTSVTTPVRAASGINQEINFQGRLLTSEGATVPDGFYNIEFKIYQDGDGQSAGDATGSPAGSLKWTEDYLNTNSQGVMVKNGFLSVQLGSVTPFGSSIDWNQTNLWLSMNIGGTGTTCSPFSTCSPDGEMTPLKRLSSTPYALNSGLLGGLASSQFIQIGQGVQTDANSGTSSIYINKTNTGNLLQLQSGGNDAFVLNNSGDIAFGANANHTISVATAAAGVAGKSLTLTGGTAGTGGSALAGGNLVLQGGTGGGTNGAGGNIAIDAGAHTGSGADGTISIGTTTASSVNIAKAGVTTTVGGSLTVASGNINLTSGAYQVNGTPVIDSSRNLTNIGTISSGNINSQTISSTANFTGTLNAATGFKIGGLAVTGTFLRGDGTNYVGSAILAADLPSGSAYYINNSTSPQTNANLYIRSAGSGSVGAVIEGATGQSADLLRLNTYNGTSSSTVAKVDNVGNVTAGTYNGQTLSNAASFTGTMTVQGASITIGHGNSTDVTGSLKLDTPVGRMVVIQGLAPSGSGDATIQFPTIAGGNTDTVCLLTAANCTSNVVQKSSGTQNFLPKWSNAAATSIGNSEIFDNGSGVSIGSTTVTGLFNVGASNQFQVSSVGAVTAVGLNSGTGLIQGTAGLTVAGSIRLSSINTAGILHADATGVLTSSAVVLGSETSGNYVATLGTLTGLTTSGNSGAGSTPTLSVNYGNGANTAAQGNTALTFNGSGNLSGAISGTAGGGFTTTSLTVVDNPTFTGLITGQAATTALALTGTPTPGSGITSLFQLGNVISGGNTAANGGTYFGINLPGSGAGSAADILNFQANGNSKLKVTNTGAVTAAGQLTISAGGIAVSGNSTIAGTLGSLTGITSSGNITFSGLNAAGIVHNSAAGLLSTGAVALGTDTTGNYVASLGALVGLTTSGNSGASATPTLSVRYGAISGSAVQGDTALICPSGTGNLSGTGNTITLGSGGTCNALTVVNNPTFSGLVTANGGFNIGGSSTFTNASSTLNSAMALGSISGSIGLATATVDIATSFTINMVASGQTITIPDPTNATAGRIIYISNIGNQSFTLLGTTINPNTSATLIWNGTVWTFGGADGSSVLNQSATDQTANFRISGSGRAATSFLSPQFDVASSGTLSLGTGSFATAISVGKAGITTTNFGNLQIGTSGTLLTSAGAISASSTISGTTLNGTVGVNTGTTGGTGTQRIDGSGNLVNIGNLTTLGASTFATTGATGFAFKPGTDNGTAFQVQNAGGASILVVDSSNRQLKVMENGGSTNYALIYYDTATATANYTASSGTVAVGTGAGSISVVAGTGAAITMTANATSTWKTTAGSLTLQSGSGSDLILNSGSSIVSLNGSSVIKLGTSAGDPATCTVGAIVYNSTSNLFRGCQGSSPAWATLGTTTPTLQSVYAASAGGTTPEVKVDSTRGGFDIQDADSTIGGVLFSVRGSNIAGLGTNLLNVNSSNNTINIGASDTAGTLLVLDSDTDSTFNGGTASNTESVVNGAMFYSSTDHNFMCGTAGKWLTCNGLLYSNTAASASIGNCTTACGAFSTANASAVPSNYCQPGRVIRISAKGVYSTTLAPSLQFGIYYGTDGSNRANDTLIGTASGAVTTATSVSNFGWGLDYSIVCFSTTSMNGQGTAYIATATTATTTSMMYTNGATTGLSTNAAKNFYIFPTWGTASTSNNVTAQQLIISGQ